MAERSVYVLGGHQTDFARNWSKERKHIAAMIREAVVGGLETTEIDAKDVEVGHVGNFAAELYSMQGHLGAFLVDTDPAFSGLPTARHEAACASGSIAVLAASAEIEAGRYELALVVDDRRDERVLRDLLRLREHERRERQRVEVQVVHMARHDEAHDAAQQGCAACGAYRKRLRTS